MVLMWTRWGLDRLLALVVQRHAYFSEAREERQSLHVHSVPWAEESAVGVCLVGVVTGLRAALAHQGSSLLQRVLCQQTACCLHVCL